MRVEGISFDLWFTILWEDDEGLREYQRHRINALYNAFKEFGIVKKSDVKQYYKSTSHVRMHISNRNLIKLLALMLGLDLEDDLINYVTRKYIESTFYWAPHANKESVEVIPLLKEKYGVKLAVLSNTSFTSEAIYKLLNHIGLDKYFDVVISSSDIQAIKPMKKAFEAVSNAFSLSPESILHVGDTYLDDVVGAINMGFNAVLYTGLWKYYDDYRALRNRKGEKFNRNTIIINDLRELFNFIK